MAVNSVRFLYSATSFNVRTDGATPLSRRDLLRGQGQAMTWTAIDDGNGMRGNREDMLGFFRVNPSAVRPSSKKGLGQMMSIPRNQRVPRY